MFGDGIFKINIMNKNVGKIQLILGPMFGGKTSELLRLLEIIGKAGKVLYINFTGDNRTEDAFSTHNALLGSANEISSKMNGDMIKVSSLFTVKDEMLKDVIAIGIDEAQFFTNLKEEVLRFSEKLGIDVYVGGLPHDWRRQNFGGIHELLPFADDVRMLRDTLCEECAKTGKRVSATLSHMRNQSNDAQMQVGTSNFAPVCRSCFIRLNPNF